jgi:hypothetical protein
MRHDSKTERLLRAAASRIEELEATLRGIRERQALNGRTNRSDLHTRRMVRVAAEQKQPSEGIGVPHSHFQPATTDSLERLLRDRRLL